MKKFYSGLGQLAGLVTILVFAFIQLNAFIDFAFMTNEIGDILQTIQVYAVYVLAGLAGLELTAGKKVFAFIYFIILAFVVVTSFFPEVMDQIVGVIG
ncbi:MAG: hypothetical protein JEZ05_06810 [Tenericutes bacterium]|nr:hypothetical protein [Mycoplasmatota bacterium]